MQISFTQVVLRPGASDSASLDKWKDVMKKENESMVGICIYYATLLQVLDGLVR